MKIIPNISPFVIDDNLVTKHIVHQGYKELPPIYNSPLVYNSPRNRNIDSLIYKYSPLKSMEKRCSP
jgi:hypothetical protein